MEISPDEYPSDSMDYKNWPEPFERQVGLWEIEWQITFRNVPNCETVNSEWLLQSINEISKIFFRLVESKKSCEIDEELSELLPRDLTLALSTGCCKVKITTPSNPIGFYYFFFYDQMFLVLESHFGPIEKIQGEPAQKWRHLSKAGIKKI